MTEHIIGKLIDAGALILSATITVSELWLIARHRKNVIKLAINVEAYHKIEHALIKEILIAQGFERPTEGQVRYLKGQKRTNILGENSEKLVWGKEPMRLRMKYFG
jgi:hypothetical protein